MKRFYCTTCKREKRVRRLPKLARQSFEVGVDGSTLQLVSNVKNRLGECAYHGNVNGTRFIRSRVKK